MTEPEPQRTGLSLQELIEQSEWVGAVSSPSSTTSLRVDLMEGAVDRNLVGAPIVILFTQEGKPTLLLGQVVNIELSNPYVEKHSIRKITSLKGNAPPLTGKHDVRTMEILPGSVFVLEGNSLLPVNLGSVPSTGTKVYLFRMAVMERLVRGQPNIGYVGTIYGSEIPLPMYFLHFGKGATGLGEGYHIGIFGKTGSGKSFLARMLITLYARNLDMSILIIDPVGEYSRDIRSGEHMGPVLRRIGRQVEAYKFTDIVFEWSETFLRMLDRTRFYEELGIVRPENKESARELLKELLEDPQTGTIKPTVSVPSPLGPQSHPINTLQGFQLVLDHLGQNIRQIFVRDETARNRVLGNIQHRRAKLFGIWEPVARLFVPDPTRKCLGDLLREICPPAGGTRKIVSIDLSELSRFFDPEGVAILLNEIFERLERIAGEKYYRGEPLINLLIVVDEAHRFIPSGRVEDEDVNRLKVTLTRASRETRKFGLGWMFISTSIAGLEAEVLKQMRIYFFGYGLCWGTELRALRDLIGDERCINLYRTFRDPSTLIAMGGKEYPFMVYGPVSPLSASGDPLFFKALDYDSKFCQINNLVS